MRQAVQVAKRHGLAVFGRQARDFQADQFARLSANNLACRFVRSIMKDGRRGDFPTRHRPGPHGHAPGDAMQPSSQRIVDLDGAGLPGEQQENSLKSVFGPLLVIEDTPANTQDHRSMARDQGGKCRFARITLIAQEGMNQLGIRPACHRSDTEKQAKGPLVERPCV